MRDRAARSSNVNRAELWDRVHDILQILEDDEEDSTDASNDTQVSYERISSGTCHDAGAESVMSLEECRSAARIILDDPQKDFEAEMPANGWSNAHRPRGCTL